MSGDAFQLTCWQQGVPPAPSLSRDGENRANSWVPATANPTHSEGQAGSLAALLCQDSQAKPSCLLALREKPGEEPGSEGNHGGCCPQPTASERLLRIHRHAWRELKETLHPAVKAYQFPALRTVIAEHSLATRVVSNGIKEASLEQQSPFSC